MARVFNKVRDNKEENLCLLCGHPLHNHPKCHSCGLLVGPNHAASMLVEHQGRKVCKSCASKWGSLEAAHSGYAVSLQDCIGAEVGGRPRAALSSRAILVEDHSGRFGSPTL